MKAIELKEMVDKLIANGYGDYEVGITNEDFSDNELEFRPIQCPWIDDDNEQVELR